MGADMVIASLECKGTYDKCLNDTKRFERMLKKYETMPVTTPKYRKYYNEIIDYQNCDVNDNDDILRLDRKILEVLENMSFERRDITFEPRKNTTIFMTGGLSWGDSPTDSYDDFILIYCLPKQILKAGGIKC